MIIDNPPLRRVIRISEESYNRLKTISEIEHLSLNKANEIAINLFADSIEYSNKNLMKTLSQQPLLRIYLDLFKEMFKDVDIDTAKAVIDLINQGQVSFYESNTDELDDAIDKINQQGCKKIVPIVRLNDDKVTKETEKKIDESFEKFKRLSCERDEQLLFDASVGDEVTKVAFFLLKDQLILTSSLLFVSTGRR
jgi:hypothetical protein